MKNTLLILSIMILSFGLGAAEKKATKKKTAAKPKTETSEAATEQTWSRPYGTAGCGLGSLAIEKNGNQISASTTNGTFGSQTFAISSGTSNCKDGPMEEVAVHLDQFIQINKVPLASDIAKGNGENIVAVSKLLGCSDAQLLGQSLHGNFNTIFPHESVNYMEISDSIINLVRENSTHKLNCAIQSI